MPGDPTSLPPLVEPAATLTREEVARYSRHLIIPDLGVDGQKRLKNAKVLVIGAGGLGSPTLLYLAAAGVGTIGIVEFDVVDESNLQRQIIHGQSDIGRSKAQSARESVLEVNPLVTVNLHEFRLEPDNAVELFEQYDLILDGTDNFATRYMVNDAAYFLGIPYVWGSIYRFDGQASVFWPHATTEDGARALEYVKGFGSVTVLNGHIHQVMQKVEGNVTFHTARSTAFPQPAPGAAPSPGPMKVEDAKLRSMLGVASINFKQNSQPLAIIDTPLQG